MLPGRAGGLDRRRPRRRAAADRDRGDDRDDLVDVGRSGRRHRRHRRARGPVAPRRCGLRRARSRCCPERRAPFAGWERADSIVVNPHKWLFTPLDASLLLTRRMDGPAGGVQPRPGVPAHARPRRRRSTTTTSTRRSSGGGSGRSSCGSSCAGSGSRGCVARIDAHLEMAEAFAGWVDADRDWELLAPVPFSTVCFRWRPAGSRPRRGGARRGATRRSWTRSTGPARSSCRTPGSPVGSRSGSRSATCGPSRVTSSGPGRCCARRPRHGEHEAEPHDVRLLRDARGAARLVRRQPRDRRRAVARLLQEGERAAERRRGRRSSTRRCASAGSTASARASTTSVSVQRLTPRRKGSNWSAINVAKVGEARRTRAGCGRPVCAAFEARTEAKTGDLLLRTAAEPPHRRGDRAVPGRRGRLGGLAAAVAVVPQDRDRTGSPSAKQAVDARAPARDAHRGLARRAGRSSRCAGPGRARDARSSDALADALARLGDARPRRRVRAAGGRGDRRVRAPSARRAGRGGRARGVGWPRRPRS